MKKTLSLLFLVSIFVVNFSGCVPAASKSFKSDDLKNQLITDKKESAEVKLAKCMTQKGIKLYTSRTCPHCTTQKEMFKDGLEYLSNTDCLKPDGSGWSDVCTVAGIEAVPTWIFVNADKVTGTTALNILAEKAGCEYNP
jgi:hypothetical protein